MQVAPLDTSAFGTLKTNHADMDALPPAIAKRMKDFNRYKNILPNVHSRVNLEQIGGDTTTSYINANFIANARNNPKAYIAAQGPKPETVVAFWRMIWQEDVRAIVMVTGLMEGHKQKCARYWPEKLYKAEQKAGAVKYGDVEVRVITGSRASGYKTATLHVVKGNEPVREVKHFWFDTWPDYGVPSDFNVVPAMLKDVRSFSLQKGQPWLVHCSAGIGRTGTFIGIDVGMDVLETARKVDTVSLVKMMRRDRGGMVQTPEQCEFVYESLRAFSAERNIALETEAAAAKEYAEANQALYGNVTLQLEPVGGVYGAAGGLRGDSGTDDADAEYQNIVSDRELGASSNDGPERRMSQVSRISDC
jgi:receptor-type tyrosine-protein phosphatase R